MKKIFAPFAAALCVAAAPHRTETLQDSGAVRVGRSAPSFGGWSLDGKEPLTLDKLRHKDGQPVPLLVTFGASWCTACASGLPRLVSLAKKHPELRLVLIDVEPEAEKAQRFAARMGVTGPALLDKFEVVARSWGVSGRGKSGSETTQLPRTFLVDVHNRVRAIYTVEGDDLEERIEADLASANAAVTASDSR